MLQRAIRLLGLFFLYGCACLVATSAFAADSASLHERIDALLESTALGPLPPQTDDAEFLRRVSLDLVGVIPPTIDARAFLDDKSPDKRAKLIDRLLADPRYARWLSTVFDVTLMERRPDSVVKGIEFQNWLYQAFADNRPYNELAREILAADVKDGANPPAARFILDRGVEPNLLTRDIGRLFFGMDLQCAQCHDHPLVDDYYQADYYGLYAFVNRTFLFTDKKDKKAPKFMAEKADGDVSFKSVFTGHEGNNVRPRMPKETALVEPVVAKGQEYLVAPEKDNRPVPRYSRRMKLAELVGAGENTAFNRNIANRLWAHMFGRGIVHPVDFQHPDNPPSHPELLDLLANEFRKAKYDIKWFLRELALSRAYQRSCLLPSADQIKVDQVTARLKQLEAEQAKCKTAQDAALAEVDKLAKILDGLKAPPKTPDAEIAKLDAAAKAAITARDKAAKEALDAKNAATAKDDALKLLNAAVAANQALVEKLASDKIAADAAMQIIERAKQVRIESEQAKQKAATLAKAAQDATAAATQAEQALAKAKNPAPAAGDREKLEAALQVARNQLSEARVKTKTCEARVSDAKALVDYQKLAKSDRAAAERAWSNIIETWTNRGYVATLKPLAPEQFALSLMQAVGQLEAQRTANVAAIDKKPPEELQKAEEKKKEVVKAQSIERQTFDQVRPSLGVFVNLYGGQPGQDFAATLNQALFFGNGTLVDSWLASRPGQLMERLTKQSDDRALTEDLYLSVFTRRPSDREIAEVVAYLKDRKSDRLLALQEIVWGLLSSNEFRFNH